MVKIKTIGEQLANELLKKGGRPLVWTDEKIEVEAQALEEWSKLPTSLTIDGFSIDRPDPYSTQQLYGVAEKSERLTESIIRAKQRLSNRREGGGLEGKLEAGLVGKTLTFYNSRYAEHILEMKAKEGEILKNALTPAQLLEAIKEEASH